MLSSIVKEHQSKQAARKERQGTILHLIYYFNAFLLQRKKKYFEILFFTEQKRKEAVQAASNLTQALVDHLNVG